jgi:hypothetical protein
MPEYPDSLLKGIPSNTFIIGKSVSWLLFQPPTGDIVNGWKESSINWEDDDGAVEQLLSASKDGGLHFKGGIARILRSRIDGIIEQFQAHGRFSYERKPLNENIYHGNLLFAHDIEKELKVTICGALAGAVSIPLIPQPED